MKFICTNNTLVSDSGEFQIGAPNEPNPAQNITLIGGNGGNTINNYKSVNALIKLGSGDDSVCNNEHARNATIVTGNGSDTITVWSKDLTTIKFNGRKNLVRISANANLLLDTGTSNNYEMQYFNSASANVTLTNGLGNYTVRGTTGDNVFDYTIPGSNLVIVAYGGEDSIRVNQPIGAPAESGDDVYIPVGRNGSITVKNARAHTINLNGRSIVVGKNASGFSPLQIMQKFMGTLNRTKFKGMAAVDAAIAKSSTFSNAKEVIDCMINDCRRINDSDTFLRDCCSIIFENADTGSITGWDMGMGTVKTAESIVDEIGSVKTFRGSSFTVNGLKVNVPTNLSRVEQSIVNGLYTWWVKNTLDLIEASYGLLYRFDNPRASVREINVEFVNEDNNYLASVWHSNYIDSGKTYKLTLKINLKYYAKLNLDDPNGSTAHQNATLLDRVMAHEFTHAIMAANIPYFNALPAWLTEGTAELTHGISDERRGDLKILGGDWQKLRAVFTDNPSASAVQIPGVYSPVYAGGFIFLHYFAKKVANTSR